MVLKPTHAKHMCNVSAHAASYSQTYEACFVAVCIPVVFGSSQCEQASEKVLPAD